MNKKKNSKTVAVIDIGSNMVKMRVAQLQNGAIRDIDRLEYPIRLGHEVFQDGKISFESLRELSSILRGYSQVMTEYGVSQYKIVATTVFRDALNRAYIVDQLKVQNDMNVEVLEDEQEKTLIYSEILKKLTTENLPELNDALISYIGTGSLSVALYHKGGIVFSQNIPVGSLKLHDMLSGLQDEGTDFATVLDEYLDGVMGRIALPMANKNTEYLIITGNEMELIAQICKVPMVNGRYAIEAHALNRLYTQLNKYSTEHISKLYGITAQQAEILYSALAIYTHILRWNSANHVLCPKLELWDAIMRQLLVPKSKGEYDEQVRQNAISCAMTLAAHFNGDENHIHAVREYACAIFDRMKKIHGLSSKRRLLLELACILHEAGYYVNSKHHLRATFDLLRNTGLYGITEEEVLLVAHIASFTDFFSPGASGLPYPGLSEKNKLVVSKLVAIFQLANALDKSSKQKLQSIRIRLSENTLNITGVSDQNVTLERWAFRECAPFFEEVFGIKPQLSMKSLLF